MRTTAERPVSRVLAAASCLLLLLGVAPPAAAQNIAGSPTYGAIDLSAGFQPDPTVRRIAAGGGDQTTMGGCTAYIHAASPDLDVNYQAGSLPLTISARSAADVVLLVNAPDGTWHCDDDSGPGNSPLLIFTNPGSGQYNIWIGTFAAQSGALPSAELYISELGDGAERSAAAGAAGSSGIALNWRAEPMYGSISLKAGFAPDPYSRAIAAGGSDPVPDLGPSCRGYVNARAPDLNLDFAAGASPLNIYAVSDTDVTLVVNLPDGSWGCSDDASGTNPHVRLDSPASGSYNIWIGTYRASASPLPESVLYVSERDPVW